MKTHTRHTHEHPTVQSVALASAFSLTLAISLFAAGFATCTLPGTTAVLSRLFSNVEQCVYLPADTNTLAVATRNYTVDNHGSHEAQACNELAQAILEAARNSAAPHSLKAHLWKQVRIGTDNSTATMYELAKYGSAYALGEAEIQHLQDCNKLIRIAVPVLIIIAAIALVSGIMLRVSCGKRPFGRALMAAPALLLVTMIALLVWALVDFNAFFSAFHGLLFPQGNWTFPADSLLICMLPTAFWLGMAFVWAFVTISLSVFAVFAGRALTRS